MSSQVSWLQPLRQSLTFNSLSLKATAVILPRAKMNPPSGDILSVDNICSLLAEHRVRGPPHPRLKVTILPGDKFSWEFFLEHVRQVFEKRRQS